MTAGIDQPFKFLGCTVSQVSASFGINGQPTTLDIRLVEDRASGDLFLADNYVPPSDSDQESSSIATAIGGEYYKNGNPGFFTSLKLEQFIFGGIVTSYKRSGSTSGRFIDVQLSDPRILLKEYPVVMEFDIKLWTDQTAGSAWDYNVFNPLRNSNPLNEDITSDGIRFLKIRAGIENLSIQFFGTTYKIKFDASFKKEIGGNYRIPLQNTNIEQVISRAAEDNSMDWYAECITTVGNSNQIIVYGIARKNQHLSTSTALTNFIASQNNVISYEIGRELRTDASQTVVYGDKVRTLSLVTPENVFPIFAERADGSFSDDGFVDLSGITSENLNLLNGLPTFNISQTRNSKVVGSQIAASEEQATYYSNPNYKKHRVGTLRRGYYVNEFIARAALHSKAAWTTAVWYFYKDGGQISRVNRSSFDISWNTSSITQTSIDGMTDQELGEAFDTNLPEKLGIYAPDFDRDNLTFTNLPISASTAATPYSEALKEAAYQATLTMADSYYGKVFIGALDHYSSIASLVSNSNGSYSYSLKSLPMEFGLINAAPNIKNINGEIQHLPPIMFDSQNSAFNEESGLIKPFMLTRMDMLYDAYERVDISHFDSATTLKLATENDSIEVNSGNVVNFCNAGIGLSSYKYDPRFVVVTANEPVYLDYGLIRWFQYNQLQRYIPSDPEVIGPNGIPALVGQIKTITNGSLSYIANPYSESNKSGGTQEFFSWLYRGYTIVYGLDSALLSGGAYVDINKSTKKITASKYDEIMSTLSDVHKDQIGFAQRRDINAASSINIYAPLVWNYIKYGPFTSTDTDSDKDVPTQFIEDSSINPWAYGNLSVMNQAGRIIASNASAKSRTLGYASVSVHGLPRYQLGKAIVDGVSNIANISELSISVGVAGPTTSYRLRTFFGGAGIRKKVEIDKVSRVSTSAKQSKEIKLDDIIHGLVPKGLKLSSFSKPSSYASPSSSNTVFTSSGRAGNSGKSSISIVTDNAPKLADENGAGTNSMVAFSNMSELFQPVTAKAVGTEHLIAPTIQGIRIT